MCSSRPLPGRCVDGVRVVELLRFALYGRFNPASAAVTLGVGIVAFLLASRGYDPQRGVLGRRGRDDG